MPYLRALSVALLLAGISLAAAPTAFRLVAEPCEEDLFNYRVLTTAGEPVDLPPEIAMGFSCAYGVGLDPSGRFLLYPNFDSEGAETLHVYDLTAAAETDRIALLPADVDAISYTWASNPTRFAFAPAASCYPTGYRVFVYQLSDEGRLSQVGGYDLKLKPACHNEFCEALAGESFYLKDPYTLVYKTWTVEEDEPDGPETLQLMKLPKIP